MMDIGWTEFARYLGGAFALYLVLEGILPFVNPGRGAAADGETGTNRAGAAALGRLDQHGGGLALLWMARNG